MYHQINATEMFRERQLALLGEAENRRLARRLHAGRIPKARSAVVAVTVVGFLAVLVVASLTLVVSSGPAHADTVFTVNSTGDENDLDFPGGTFDNSSEGTCDVDSGASGDQCTLRAAIQEANVTAGADTINFNIPGSGVHTISPSSPLPRIFEQVTINGYSQPNSSANTLATGTNANLLIEIDGTNSKASGAVSGLTILASNTVVKGLVINRFVNTGAIDISQNVIAEPVTNVRIEGNFIGTDPTGTVDEGNANGLFIWQSAENTIGGTSLASRNLISGNNNGIYVETDSINGFAPSTNNTIKSNLIGPERDGVTVMGNGFDAIALLGDGTTGTRILSNSILASAELGIDLRDDGPTPNDLGDTDVGANDAQNFPVLTSARTSRRGTTIKGTLNSRPGASYTVQFFSNPPGTDEGARLIGQRSVTVDGSGNASFSFKPKKKVGVGQNITATATNEFTGDTSEFSAPKAVTRAR